MKKILIALVLLLPLNNVLYPQQDTSDNIIPVPQQYHILKKFYEDNYLSKGLQLQDMKGTGYKNLLVDKWFFDKYSSEININAEKNFYLSRLSSFNLESKFSANWKSLGPNSIDSMSGRMVCAEFDPNNPDIIWSGASSGGLWKSTNASEDWFSVTDDLPSMIVSCVKIKNSNPQIMLIGTGNDRFFSITVGPGVGVLKSTDAGASWNQTGFSYNVNQGVSVSELIWPPQSGDTVYMAASNGVWKSNDAGSTWNLILNGRASSLVINKLQPNILYTVLRSQGVYKSTNSGVNWKLLSNGIITGANVDLSSITICDSLPDILYTSFSNVSDFSLLGVYKTTDGGNQWNVLPNVPNVLCHPTLTSICIGWFVNKIKVSPHDPNRIIFGGLRFSVSTNGGSNWIFRDTYANGTPYSQIGVVHNDLWDVQFHPTNPDVVYVFNDGGVQKSTNGGLWWNKKNNNLVTAQIYKIGSSPLDTNIILAGTQDNGLLRLDNTNGNTFWYLWGVGDGTNVIVDHQNPNIFYGDYFFGEHRRNLAGGINWLSTTTRIMNGIAETSQSLILICPLIMNPLSSNILYTSTDLKIYKTTNQGTPWFPVANIPNVYTLAIDNVNPDIVYAHSYTNTSWSVWKSINGGTNWSQINHSSIPSWRVVDLKTDPSNSGIVYAVRNSNSVNQDHIKKSTDFGETWINITSDLPDVMMNAITISPHNSQQLYVATNEGVFATTNGGANWFEYNEGLPKVVVSDIHYHLIDRTLRIATIGRGAYKTKAIDSKPISVGNNTEIISDFNLRQNYPNPFNGSTNIEFSIHKRGAAIIYIYNSVGQKIFEGELSNLSVGANKFTWNGKNNFGFDVSSGIYYLKLSFNGVSKTIKMNFVK